MPYTNTRNYLTAEKGVHLFWQKWIPSAPVRLTLLIQHGLGEHCGRYGNLLQALEGSGVAVYAMDARGHGRSQGKKGHIAYFDQYAEDLDLLVEIALTDIRLEKRPKKVMLLGHSLGGSIAIRYASLHQQKLDALILSSAGIEVHMNLYNHVAKRLASGLVKILPGLVLSSNLNADYLSHDQQVVDAYRVDPLTHDKASVRLGHDLFNIHRQLYQDAPGLRLPLYIFHGSADQLTNPEGSRRFFEKAASADKTLRIYEGLFHETMNEIPLEKSRVLEELKQWMLLH
ncbi:MAG: lysophospholipase [Cyclobacteriaceae bacterium]